MLTVPPEQMGLWKLWHWPHVACQIEKLREAIAGEEVVFGPFFPAPLLEVAFVHKNGVIIEYMQYLELDHWFGQASPPGYRHELFTE